MATNLFDECTYALIDALASPFLDVRKAAIKCLVRLGDARAIGPIIESIRDIPTEDRDTLFQYINETIINLCIFYDTSIIKQLAAILDEIFDDPFDYIYELTEGGDRSVIQSLAEYYELEEDVLDEVAFGSYSVYIKKLIIHILMDINTIDSNYILLKFLNDPDTDEYLLDEAITALGMNQWAPAFEPLCEILLNENLSEEESRSAAALALGRIGDPRAIPPLVKAVSDPNIEKHSWLVDCVSSALHLLSDDLDDLWDYEYEENSDEVE
ncbi:HEAT repeat protein [Methanocalculus sp. AMF5]|uniref:HEAT repeat domain-containing protein n=1 Tax=Methanocalculus sp. AMF5 TaxID=1198257 RepID=UPI00209FCB93|nr:HEAT repeat domain-containing protein [Methanocalculus sp. AMF5]MCP1662124.1 HEAT repeat protein [Methanocalculus sp. AMF5]